jgi:aryl-alcohol dehydrogenase-like predicted oxidoreductase
MKETKMEYRRMGSTGLRVSELCLGAMTFGRETPEVDSYKILDRFVDAGGNFIDTADVYSQGISETILGKWLKGKKRDDLIIATKVRFAMGDGPNDSGLSRKHIMAGINASLQRLGTEYIDLYQVHMWDPDTPLEETLGTLDNLVKSGKVRYVGASNFAGYQLQKSVDTSMRMGWESFSCLQPLYNLLDRSIEWEIIPVCERHGIGIIPWSPLRGGWLSGKYKRGMSAPLPDTRVDDATKLGWSEAWNVYDNDRTWNVIDVLFSVANDLGKTPAQVALRWLLQKPMVTAPILGVRTLGHLEDNLGAAGWQLSLESMEKLDLVSQMDLVYPYNFLANLTPKK